MTGEKTLKITLVKSAIGYNIRQKRTLYALGLRKHQRSVLLPDNPAVRGMLRAVAHLVSVEEVTSHETA